MLVIRKSSTNEKLGVCARQLLPHCLGKGLWKFEKSITRFPMLNQPLELTNKRLSLLHCLREWGRPEDERCYPWSIFESPLITVPLFSLREKKDLILFIQHGLIDQYSWQLTKLGLQSCIVPSIKLQYLGKKCVEEAYRIRSGTDNVICVLLRGINACLVAAYMLHNGYAMSGTKQLSSIGHQPRLLRCPTRLVPLSLTEKGIGMVREAIQRYTAVRKLSHKTSAFKVIMMVS